MFNRFLKRTHLLNRRAWNFTRVLRVSLGLAVLIAAIMQRDWMPGLFGLLFLYQGVYNVGCCGADGCEIPQGKSTVEDHRP
ncbi:MAG TPA: hypothetical protein DIW47_03720 [Bacteroidetes bacterium]|nr:hypothetical protein [Bacteroidota bacterium]